MMKLHHYLRAISVVSVCVLFAFLCSGQFAVGQEGNDPQQAADPPTSQQPDSDADVQKKLQEQAKEIGDNVKDIGETLDQSETAQELSAGILKPIYLAAEYISVPAFHWIAFAMMVAGVISFAGQLVFAKFFLLFRGHINIKEILSDALGLLISAVGLILTTQAATENSDFASRPVLVLSATAVGVLVGLVFYWWGQSQEFKAARGSNTQNQTRSAKMR